MTRKSTPPSDDQPPDPIPPWAGPRMTLGGPMSALQEYFAERIAAYEWRQLQRRIQARIEAGKNRRNR